MVSLILNLKDLEEISIRWRANRSAFSDASDGVEMLRRQLSEQMECVDAVQYELDVVWKENAVRTAHSTVHTSRSLLFFYFMFLDSRVITQYLL